jgi:hypothetical protein
VLGTALVLTAGPAAASPASPTAESGVVPFPTETPQPDATPRLVLTQFGGFGPGSQGPLRPGDEASFGATLVNDGQEREEYVLTFTLPPEMTLISLRSAGAQVPEGCSGNVCRGTIDPGRTIENQIFAGAEGRVRLASSFRGDTTTIRADLQAGANPDPSQLTRTLTVPVAQPSAGQPAAGAPSSGTGTGATTLPRTGDHTPALALTALAMLGLGVAAQVAGRRRPAATIG